MDIVLTHKAALAAIRGRRYSSNIGRACSSALPSKMPTPDEVDTLLCRFSELETLEEPLDILVDRASAHHNSGRLSAHVWSTPLRAGALIELSPGVRCASPAFLPILMAPTLTDLELQMLLGELLGLYGISRDFETGLFQRRVPLTTPNEITELIDAISPAKGCGTVRRALAKAPILAASPQEAKLYLRATLPFAKGGYNMGRAVLNNPVELQRISNTIQTLQTRKPDLMFLNGNRGVCLDYMGAWHDNLTSVRSDTQRRNELIANGFKPYEIYKRHYDDLDYMDALMAKIRKDLGLYRERPGTRREGQRQWARHALWQELEAINL